MGLDRLRKEGEYQKIVQTLEESLEIQQSLNDFRGVIPRTHNHGYSYLFVTLYPAANDLPPYLGPNATHFLFDAWHDLDLHPKNRAIYETDELAIALSHSKDRLLRAIAYWVLKDYVNFEKESIEGAITGDKRMDSLALVAACVFSKDKKVALSAVEPILDRGVGVGPVYAKGTYSYASSNDIRLVLEGKVSADTLGGYYMRPPSKRVP